MLGTSRMHLLQKKKKTQKKTIKLSGQDGVELTKKFGLVAWAIPSEYCTYYEQLLVHQQRRSYGDGTSVYSLIRKTGEAWDRTHKLDKCNDLLNNYTTEASKYFWLLNQQRNGQNVYRLTDRAKKAPYINRRNVIP